jgi:23S rRNA (cytosine1962-C5)-methyltransferase
MTLTNRQGVADFPRVQLTPDAGKRRAVRGHPWVFSNEILMTAEAKALPPGSVVHLAESNGRVLGAYHFNPHSLIAARLLTRSTTRGIDAAFFAERLTKALSLREKLFDVPYYRLVHAEGDLLPGLIVDRYGDTLVVQANTAGMDAARDPLVAALKRVLSPAAILWAADSAARQQEGLEPVSELVHGSINGPLTLIENGVTFYADPVGGQKTGWFFDHRNNRAFAAGLARGGSALDLYAYAGGFGLTAAAAGATAVLSVDRAAGSLALAQQAAEANGLAEIWSSETAEIFKWLEQAQGRFDVVVADPPAFAKTKKDIAAATKGYEKLARLAAQRVAGGGFLCLASCSYHMTADAFQTACADGIREGGRGAALIHSAGAGPDHPVHPQLAQTAYLKFVVYRLD